jgi:hypothetical protein
MIQYSGTEVGLSKGRCVSMSWVFIMHEFLLWSWTVPRADPFYICSIGTANVIVAMPHFNLHYTKSDLRKSCICFNDLSPRKISGSNITTS